MSVWGGLGREKEENSEDFYEYLGREGVSERGGIMVLNNEKEGWQIILAGKRKRAFPEKQILHVVSKEQARRNTGVKN